MHEHRDKREEERQDEPAPEAPLAPVIPIRPETQLQEVKNPRLGANLPLLNLLITLKESRGLLLELGRRIYARVRREQNGRRLRKGIVIDRKV